MNLYRFEVTTQTDIIYVVIAAHDDEQAFRLVEVELEKHFLKIPDFIDISLHEKKPIRRGSGFIVYREPRR
ncbi:DUF3906 family protein [Thermaerobacillus caldiproteolyticus]|uniref:DUF3906 domain-containing protein n=1 Tax=Thermaerobacillus caldiproteolyticus TaxID=247480 RepID=A0A7V9Z9J9_9BACL|nr:DUF3906 family protein [Anoxybacillus caldiproteolyticus]MBA2876464.1 hypothetical protein [Anoxybacillus caldiproteolyticus]QPA33347.1 DUF3906 family protein [Anoxybacillus caldiproteolyticus]